MSEVTKVKMGDLVWAKMKGFSPWPGKVTLPGKNVKIKKPKTNKLVYCIWFFGSNNFAWIEENNIKPYEKYKEQLSKACKTAQFRDACAQIEEYIRKKEAGELVDDFLPEEEEEEVDAEQISGGSPGAPNSTASGGEDNAVEDKDKPAKKTPGRKKKIQVENGESVGAKAVTPKKRRLSAGEKKQMIATVKAQPSLNHAPRKSAGSYLLDRPAIISRPDNEPLNVGHVSQVLKDKKIVPSELKFGFLGLGIMGSGMVKNLLNSGHHVCVWNRTPDKVTSVH
ncbi:unnamed protein product [Allacma fusca]|uniref:PWWP domain-containing protein n=1 Tax=Allacma fusca TaxID=39272 RepID=A0A8J2JZ46_9HEXA|nr:unnamed protein product [Allacma fusca]